MSMIVQLWQRSPMLCDILALQCISYLYGLT